MRITDQCALQGVLCTLYNIGHYPTLKFGRPADFEVSKGGKLEDYSGVRAEKEVIEWVGKLQSTCALHQDSPTAPAHAKTLGIGRVPGSSLCSSDL